jgi:hypothetical protein
VAHYSFSPTIQFQKKKMPLEDVGFGLPFVFVHAENSPKPS